MCYFHYVYHSNCAHAELYCVRLCDRASSTANRQQQSRIEGQQPLPDTQPQSQPASPSLLPSPAQSLPKGRNVSPDALSRPSTDTDLTDSSHASSVTVTQSYFGSASASSRPSTRSARRYFDRASSAPPSMASICESEAFPTQAMLPMSLANATSSVHSHLDIGTHYDPTTDRISGLTLSIDFGADATFFAADITQNDGKVKEIVARFESGLQPTGEVGDDEERDDPPADELQGVSGAARQIDHDHERADSQVPKANGSQSSVTRADTNGPVALGYPTGEPLSSLSPCPTLSSPTGEPVSSSVSSQPLVRKRTWAEIAAAAKDLPASPAAPMLSPTVLPTEFTSPRSPRSLRKPIPAHWTEGRAPFLETARRAEARRSKQASPVELSNDPKKTTKDRQKSVTSRRDTIPRKDTTTRASNRPTIGVIRASGNPTRRPDPPANLKLKSAPSRNDLKKAPTSSPTCESPRRSHSTKGNLSPTRATIASSAKEASPRDHSPMESVYNIARASPVSHSSESSYATAKEQLSEGDLIHDLAFANVASFGQSLGLKATTKPSSHASSHGNTPWAPKSEQPQLSIKIPQYFEPSASDTRTPKALQHFESSHISPTSPGSRIPQLTVRSRTSTIDSSSTRSSVIQFTKKRTEERIRKASSGSDRSSTPGVLVSANLTSLPKSQVQSPTEAGLETKVFAQIEQLTIRDRGVDQLTTSPPSERVEESDTDHDEGYGAGTASLGAGTSRTSSSGSMLVIGCDSPAGTVAKVQAGVTQPGSSKETAENQLSMRNDSTRETEASNGVRKVRSLTLGKDMAVEGRDRKVSKGPDSSDQASPSASLPAKKKGKGYKTKKQSSWTRKSALAASQTAAPLSRSASASQTTTPVSRSASASSSAVGQKRRAIKHSASTSTSELNPLSFLLRATAPSFIPGLRHVGLNETASSEALQPHYQDPNSFYQESTDPNMVYAVHQPMASSPIQRTPDSPNQPTAAGTEPGPYSLGPMGPESYGSYPPAVLIPRQSHSRSPKKKPSQYKLKSKIDRSRHVDGTFRIGQSSQSRNPQAAVNHFIQEQGLYARGDQTFAPFSSQYEEVEAHSPPYDRETHPVVQNRGERANAAHAFPISPNKFRHTFSGHPDFVARSRHTHRNGFYYTGRIGAQRVPSAGIPLSRTAPFPNPVPPQYTNSSATANPSGTRVSNENDANRYMGYFVNEDLLIKAPCGLYDTVQSMEWLGSTCNKCAPDH